MKILPGISGTSLLSLLFISRKDELVEALADTSGVIAHSSITYCYPRYLG